jgi:hypothetical protein
MQTGLSHHACFSPARNIEVEGLGADQTPDEGAEAFVRQMMLTVFDEDTYDYPEAWIPLVILGTLDWLFICNWWVWYYTGIFQSGEPYKWVFRYHSMDVNEETGEVDPIFYEFDPDQLVVFLEDPETNTFQERWDAPGLTDRERGEVIRFLSDDVFGAMNEEPPPQGIMERLAYCVFMWVLSENGREWLCEIDPVYSCVDEFKVAYLEKWENTLLDPTKMEKTKRVLGTCAVCGEELSCVYAAGVYDLWVNLCNECLIQSKEEDPESVNLEDGRLQKPLCGFRGGPCINTNCPHNPITREDLGDAMAEAGARRVETWRKARLASNEPRKVAGRTVEQAVEYFKDVDYGKVLQMIETELIDAEQYDEAVEALDSLIHDPNVRSREVLSRGCSILLELYQFMNWQYRDDIEEVQLILDGLS